MESIPQGQCLIVNVAHFQQHDDRPGSDVDAVKLHSLFENVLNFVVTRVDDPTLQKLHQTLIEFFQMDHSAYDVFFIIILSHGDPGDVIYTSDSQSIKISEISDHFTASNCPTLANKPKVFIVQACRGQKHHTPVVATVPHSRRRASQDQTSTTILDEATMLRDAQMMHDEQTVNLDVTMSHSFSSHGSQYDALDMSHDGGGFSTHNSNTTIQTIPDKKDFYYAFATIDNYEAMRHPTDGSWFIDEFVITVKRFAQHGHVYLQDLMLKVTERLSQRSHKDRMQVCEVKSSITKNIILTVKRSFCPSERSVSSSNISQNSLPGSRRGSRASSHHDMHCRPFRKSDEGSSLICASFSSLHMTPPIPKSQMVTSYSSINLKSQYSETSYPPSKSHSRTLSSSNYFTGFQRQYSETQSHPPSRSHSSTFSSSNNFTGFQHQYSETQSHPPSRSHSSTFSSSNNFTGFQHQYSETQSHPPSRSHSITSSLSEALQPSSETLQPSSGTSINNMK